MKLENFTNISAIFTFCDVREFTPWSKDNQMDIADMLNILYSVAIDVFGNYVLNVGDRQYVCPTGIVKFLGDGFFSVDEYELDKPGNLILELKNTIKKCVDYINRFNHEMKETTIRGSSDITVGMGISYGRGHRFNLPALSEDYVGDRVNIAAKYCSIAESNQIIIDPDIFKKINYSPFTNIGLRIIQPLEDIPEIGKIVRTEVI